MDSFYDSPNATSTAAGEGLFSTGLSLICNAPLAALVTLTLIPFLLIITTRLLSGYASQKNGKVEMLPYWIPVVGHTLQL